MPGKLGDKVRLQHALDAIETINGYVLDASFDVFLKNQMMRDACIRQLQVIGEACGKISLPLRETNPQVPWRQIIGLRILVVHEYFGIDDEIVWGIIQNDLPTLHGEIAGMLEKLEK